MEFKVVIYIVGAVLYFLYTAYQKSQEQKKNTTTPTAKPVAPPAAKGFEEILRELQQKQQQATAQANPVYKPTKSASAYQPKKQKEILVHQKQPGVFAEGNYERNLTEEEKIERGKLKIENEGIYKIQSAEEQETETTGYNLDVRQALIGSFILERKF